MCEDNIRSQPNVPASATLDYDIEAGGDDFVIVGFVLGEGLADGLPAERVPVDRILSDGRSSFFSCTVRYHRGDDRYELLRGSVTIVPAQP